MSAVAALYRRRSESPDAPADEAVFERVLRALDGRGPDGADAVRMGPVRLGHQHFWTTPEEVGERQPTVDPEGRWVVAFEGRLDNRQDLLDRLEVVPEDLSPDTSDARLVLAAYERWGERCVEELLGPFALILFDCWSRSLLCARDPLGQRSLFYRAAPDSFVAASEESAVLAHPEVSGALDEETVARYFARRAPRRDAGPGAGLASAAGRTFFADVRELAPGHLLRVDSERLVARRFWGPCCLPEPAGRRSDEDWAEELRFVLEQSVEARMRSRSAPWALLSGGLDSSSVAAVGAALQGRRGQGPLRAVSWVFDRLPACDESARIRAVVDRIGAAWHPVRADDLGPLSDLSAWPLDPSRPEADAFGWTVDRAYREISDHGGRVALTGYWGNHLCAGGGGWMGALLREGRVLEALRAGWGRLAAPSRAAALGRGLGALVGRSRVASHDPWLPWLTPETRSLLGPEPDGGGRGGIVALDPALVWAAPVRWRRAARRGIDLRDPLRDRRLVELVHRMPAHQRSRGGWSRYVCRRALAGTLPDAVLWTRDEATLVPFFRKGLWSNRRAAREILWSREAVWHRYLRPETVDRLLTSPDAEIPAERLTLTWLALAFEHWRSVSAETARETDGLEKGWRA